MGVYVPQDRVGKGLHLSNVIGVGVNEIPQGMLVVETEEITPISPVEDNGMTPLPPAGRNRDTLAAAMAPEKMEYVGGLKAGLIPKHDQKATKVGRQRVEAHSDRGDHAAAGIGIANDPGPGRPERVGHGLSLGPRDDHYGMDFGLLQRLHHASHDRGVPEWHQELGGAKPRRFPGRQHYRPRLSSHISLHDATLGGVARA